MRLLLVLFAFLAAPSAFAVARPHHNHDDVFGESDLLLGLKGGPQVTSYSSVNLNGSNYNVTSTVGFLGGAALQFVYGLPRIELDFFVSYRGGVSTDQSVFTLDLPLLLKFPIAIDQGQDFYLGPGIQPEAIVGGVNNARAGLFGLMGVAGFMIDYGVVVFEIEARYVYGLFNASTAYQGGVPQDLQVLAGAYWHL